jgi:hypothetical protein
MRMRPSFTSVLARSSRALVAPPPAPPVPPRDDARRVSALRVQPVQHAVSPFQARPLLLQRVQFAVQRVNVDALVVFAPFRRQDSPNLFSPLLDLLQSVHCVSLRRLNSKSLRQALHRARSALQLFFLPLQFEK